MGAVRARTDELAPLLKQVVPLAEAVPDGLVIAGSDGRILAVNGRMLALTGCQENDLLGSPVEVLVPKVLRSAHVGHRRAFAASPALRPMGTNLTVTCLRANGTEFPADIALSPVRWAGRDLVVAAIRDITERKAAERARQEVEQRLELLLNAVQGYAIFMLDSDGRVASWNDGAQRLKGYRVEEILGQPLSVFYASEDVRQGKPGLLLAEAARSGRAEDVGWRVRSDGSQFRAMVTITALRDEFGTLHGYAKIVRDVTEALRVRDHEERLHLLEARERFGRDLHDGVIQSLFAVGMSLQASLPLADDDRLSERIRRAVDELDDVIRDLRNFIYGLRYRPALEALRGELEGMAGELQERTGIVASVSIDDDALSQFEPHADDIVLLAKEALSNVARHSGARLCSVTVRREHGETVLEVNDNGRGFDQSSSRAGLGLLNAQDRARAIGAGYEIETSDEGTSVRVRVTTRRD